MNYTGKDLCVVRGNNQVASAPIFEGTPIYSPTVDLSGWEYLYLGLGLTLPYYTRKEGYVPFLESSVKDPDYDESIPLNIQFSQYTKTCTWPKCTPFIDYTWNKIGRGPYGPPYEYYIVPSSMTILYGIKRSLEIVVLWHQLNIGWQAQSIGVLPAGATEVTFSGQYGGGCDSTESTAWYFVIRDNNTKEDIVSTPWMSFNSASPTRCPEITRRWWK